jgi:ABC-type amino acid transport substrate-binding protein
VRQALGLALAAVALAAAGAGAAQHEGLAAVQARGHLRVCADPANLPYASNDPAVPGFEVELARLIARELGVEARLEWHSSLVRALRPLREGTCELFMGLPQDARFRQGNPWIAVSRPYYVMVHALVGRAGAGPLSMEALAGKRVAVELASLAEFHVAYRDIERNLHRSQQQAFQAAASGEAVAAFLWWPVAAWLARDRPDLALVPVTDEALRFPIGAGVRRRDPGLAPAVDAAVERLLASGAVRDVLARYRAEPPAPRASSAVPRAGRPDDVVLAAAVDAVERGRSLFSTACSRCHGAEGVGGGTGGAIPPLRNYDGGREKFMRILANGRKNTAMAGFKGILTAEEMDSIYQYLTSRPSP